MVVRGPLGSGKSTLAQALAGELGARYIAIDRILEEHHLERWQDGYISEPSFLAANDHVVQEARPTLKAGAPVVIDGNFYWRSAVQDLIDRLPFPHVICTLRIPAEDCVARDAGRPGSFGAEATRAVYAKVTSFEVGVPVNVAGSPGESLNRLRWAVRDRLRRGGTPVAGGPRPGARHGRTR